MASGKHQRPPARTPRSMSTCCAKAGPAHEDEQQNGDDAGHRPPPCAPGDEETGGGQQQVVGFEDVDLHLGLPLRRVPGHPDGHRRAPVVIHRHFRRRRRVRRAQDGLALRPGLAADASSGTRPPPWRRRAWRTADGRRRSPRSAGRTAAPATPRRRASSPMCRPWARCTVSPSLTLQRIWYSYSVQFAPFIARRGNAMSCTVFPALISACVKLSERVNAGWSG